LQKTIEGALVLQIELREFRLKAVVHGFGLRRRRCNGRDKMQLPLLACAELEFIPEHVAPG
jgi:hypothetical protein